MKRYFHVVVSWVWASGHGSTGSLAAVTPNGEYVSMERITRRVRAKNSVDGNVVEAVVILNIVEMSERDFLDFTNPAVAVNFLDN